MTLRKGDKVKKLPTITITRLSTIPKNGNFELCAPGGKDGCENVVISFPSPASGLIKMKANWAIKEKHIFMVMDLERQ